MPHCRRSLNVRSSYLPNSKAETTNNQKTTTNRCRVYDKSELAGADELDGGPHEARGACVYRTFEAHASCQLLRERSATIDIVSIADKIDGCGNEFSQAEALLPVSAVSYRSQENTGERAHTAPRVPMFVGAVRCFQSKLCARVGTDL
jgi:hypothetical protein